MGDKSPKDKNKDHKQKAVKDANNQKSKRIKQEQTLPVKPPKKK